MKFDTLAETFNTRFFFLQKEVSLFPRDTSTEMLSSNYQLYVYNVNKNTGVVTGFKINTDNKVKAEMAWTFEVPASHEIISVAGKFQNEKVGYFFCLF